MRVYLADDEHLALRGLTLVLRGLADVDIVGTAFDGDTALEEIRRLQPDLAILDIEMPGRSGIEVAAALESESGPEIVFLTAFDRYATAAFTVEAADYLLKPVQHERLVQAIERARRRQAARHLLRGGRRPPGAVVDGDVAKPVEISASALHLPGRDGGRHIEQSDIVWIEAAKDYVLIHTAMRSHILRITMSVLRTRLDSSIVRVHRSAFVSTDAVRSLIRSPKGLYTLSLVDGTQVQVGPSYAQTVKEVVRALRL